MENNTHKYEKEIALHNKAIDILDLRKRALVRLQEAEDKLQQWDNAISTHSDFRLVYKREDLQHRVNVCKRSVSFLAYLYGKTASKVCDCIAVPVVTYQLKEEKEPVNIMEQIKTWMQQGNSVLYGHPDIEDVVLSDTILNNKTLGPLPKWTLPEDYKRASDIVIHKSENNA